MHAISSNAGPSSQAPDRSWAPHRRLAPTLRVYYLAMVDRHCLFRLDRVQAYRADRIAVLVHLLRFSAIHHRHRPVVDGAKPASERAAPSASLLPRSIVIEQAPCVGVFGAEERGYRDIPSTEIGPSCAKARCVIPALLGQGAFRSLWSRVRQLRGPHVSTCAWWRSRSSIAVTAAVSPRSLPQSSTGRFDVSSVEVRS